MVTNILGISAYYHDSAAALICDGKIVAAAQEERFSRKKHDSAFPRKAIQFCLAHQGISLEKVDCVVFYDKPLLKFERLLETYLSFSPFGFRSFLAAMPIWLKEKLYLKVVLRKELSGLLDNSKNDLPRLLFTEHHKSHAASAFYPSPFKRAAVICMDGVGEWATTSTWLGDENTLTSQWQIDFPHSLGLLYSAFTYYTGFKVNSGEYKLMGLAPYGNPNSNQTQKFINLIKNNLVDIKDDGSIWLNQTYYNYATGLRMVKDNKWQDLFGFDRRTEEIDIEQHHCNLALAIQIVTEEIVLKMGKEAKRLTKSDNLCLAGGVALNCVANGKLQKEGIFKNIYIQPAAGDAGAALGAAQAIYYMYFDGNRKVDGVNDIMEGAYLGPSFSTKEIMSMNKKTKAVYENYSNFDTLNKDIAKEISEGKVVGWFQGRMEFGPRALGNRSILGDARNPEMQKKLNLKIKYREGFRPFAPSVLAEDSKKLFDLDVESPYMLLVAPINDSIKKTLPENYYDLPLWERLYRERSTLQSITHIDFSARVQTVHKETNIRYWELINAFKEITGYGLVVNTSFNVRGEPIVCTPYDAYRCFMSTEIDYLVINNFVYKKEDQIDWEDKEKWMVKFKLD
ncbi:MAG: carbamoyltransferase [Flavobacteriales bacterium]|nr:carbamoyltransferase [Flavobacteriales bacterium]